jgi:hypothetical protein
MTSNVVLYVKGLIYLLTYDQQVPAPPSHYEEHGTASIYPQIAPKKSKCFSLLNLMNTCSHRCNSKTDKKHKQQMITFPQRIV